jgi:hypothetical protein
MFPPISRIKSPQGSTFLRFGCRIETTNGVAPKTERRFFEAGPQPPYWRTTTAPTREALDDTSLPATSCAYDGEWMYSLTINPAPPPVPPSISVYDAGVTPGLAPRWDQPEPGESPSPTHSATAVSGLGSGSSSDEFRGHEVSVVHQQAAPTGPLKPR